MILTLDPAYRNTGFILIENEEIVKYGVIKAQDKDTFKNLHLIYCRLDNIVKNIKIDCIYSEQMSGSRSQRAAMLLGAVDALIIALAENYKVPLYMANERIVKKVLFGRHKVSKTEMANLVLRKHENLNTGFNKNEFEHIADSICVYYAIKRILGDSGGYHEFMSRMYIQRPQEDTV